MAPLSGISNALRNIFPESSAEVLPSITPTQTIQSIQNELFRRQSAATTTVTAVNNNNGNPDNSSSLSGGAIAGIVIGSVVGALLLFWIISSYSNLGAPPGQVSSRGGAWYDDVSPERHRHRRSRSHHSYHSHDYPRSKSREVHSFRKVRKVRPIAVVNSTPTQPAYVYDPDLRRGRSGHRSRSRH